MRPFKSVILSLFIGLSFIVGCSSDRSLEDDVATSSGAFQMPEYVTTTLETGLTLMLMPQHEVPLITVNAVVNVGSVNDTSPGLASVTAQSLLLGNKLKSKRETEKLVDSLGATLFAQAALEGSYISANFMAKDTVQMMPLLKSVLTQPTFDKQEFDKLLKRQMAYLQQAKESPKAVINNYFYAQLFGHHQYANPVSGDAQSLETITRNQVRQFHRKHFQPTNTAIVVSGDFDPVTMQDFLTELFSDWTTTATVAVTPIKPLKPLQKAKVLLINKPDAIETTFMIGGLGVSRDNPDYVSLQVINTLLGGRFTSWLNDELRVNSGLTYGARSTFSSFRQGGAFYISTFTKTETTRSAIDLALSTYARLWEQGIDQDTLDSAKAYIKGQFPPQYETNAQLANLMADMFLYRFDQQFINNFETQVNQLTLDKSQQLIERYFPRENLQFILIGQADKIKHIASVYGEVVQIEMTDPGFSR